MRAALKVVRIRIKKLNQCRSRARAIKIQTLLANRNNLKVTDLSTTIMET